MKHVSIPKRGDRKMFLLSCGHTQIFTYTEKNHNTVTTWWIHRALRIYEGGGWCNDCGTYRYIDEEVDALTNEHRIKGW